MADTPGGHAFILALYKTESFFIRRVTGKIYDTYRIQGTQCFGREVCTFATEGLGLNHS